MNNFICTRFLLGHFLNYTGTFAGRAIWCAARLSPITPDNTVQSFVQTTADALQPSSPLPLRMCACRAIAAFCPRLGKGINRLISRKYCATPHSIAYENETPIPCLSFRGTDVLAKSTFGVTIITQLVGLILRCSPETMHIVIEALTVVVRHSGNSCVAVESKLSPLVRFLSSFLLLHNTTTTTTTTQHNTTQHNTTQHNTTQHNTKGLVAESCYSLFTT
jgi:hypothetical protein